MSQHMQVVIQRTYRLNSSVTCLIFLWIGDLQAQHYYVILIFQNLHIRFLAFLSSLPNTVCIQLIHFFVALPLNSLFLPLPLQDAIAGPEQAAFSAITEYIFNYFYQSPN